MKNPRKAKFEFQCECVHVAVNHLFLLNRETAKQVKKILTPAENVLCAFDPPQKKGGGGGGEDGKIEKGKQER